MPHRIRITHEDVIDQTVSLTLRVPPLNERWQVDAPVLIEGYGFRVKSVMADGESYLLAGLVRDRSQDVEEEKPKQ